MPFLNQWKGENDRRKYVMINFHERMLLTRGGGGGGSNPPPLDHQRDPHPTEPMRPALGREDFDQLVHILKLIRVFARHT